MEQALRRFGVVPVLALALGSVVGVTPTQNAPTVHAVISLASGVERVTAPGVHVVANLRSLGDEIVTGTPAAISSLAHDGRVVGIAFDRRVSVASETYGSGEGLLASEAVGGRAGSPDAGRGVTVALVDTGVSDTPALNRASGRLEDGVDTSPMVDMLPPVDTGGPYTDGYGHGTFMASLIAGGSAPGSDGRALGVAPGAHIVNVKVADADGTTSLAAVLAGLDWVASNSNRIQVANLSLSADRPTSDYGEDPLTFAVEKLRQLGETVVVAAGNTPGQVGDPGFEPQALTVGAADVRPSSFGVASFSGSATVAGVQKPDVVAAGVRVLGLVPPGSQVAQQFPNAQQPSGLWRGSGTSESTAITSGVAALFLQRFPQATPLQVKASIRMAARPMPNDPRAGAGLVMVPNKLRDGADGGSLGTTGSAGSGEENFDVNSWSVNSWSAINSWSVNSWSVNSWSVNSWSVNSWSVNSWSVNSWSVNSWSVNSWSTNSWSTNSWSTNSWSTNSWSTNSWSTNSWSTNSWSTNSWSSDSWASGWDNA